MPHLLKRTQFCFTNLTKKRRNDCKSLKQGGGGGGRGKRERERITMTFSNFQYNVHSSYKIEKVGDFSGNH